ncbi:MAG: hypothetical protein KY443_07415 [Actinobacteria bacterium]|nr:hypothetical protein [Actinomycetota bacterium]
MAQSSALPEEDAETDTADNRPGERAFHVPTGRMRRTLLLAGTTAHALTGTADWRAPADQLREA